VREALDELRAALESDRVELVILGAREKLAQLRAAHDLTTARGVRSTRPSRSGPSRRSVSWLASDTTASRPSTS
jgi:hypothetical protein